MPFDTIRMGSSAAGAYEIERSLRFNGADNAGLSRTFGTVDATNNKNWTISLWTKRSKLGVYSPLFGYGTAASGSSFGGFYFAADDSIHLFDQGNSLYKISQMLFRDTSAWYHIVVAVDADAGTPVSKAWVNGVELTYTGQNTQPSNATGHAFTSSGAHYIGNDSAGYDYNGYIAEVHICTGLYLDHEDFGKTDPVTGAWIPKEYTGGHGTHGSYLNFSDNSNTTSGTLGDDDSANSNDWTPNNFSVAAGTGCDSMTDTPTNNYATLNSLENGYGTTTYSNGNLEVAASNEWVPMRGSIAVTSGKYYWEVYGADGNTFIGVAKDNADISTINPMLRDGVIVYYGSDGKKRIDGTFTTYGSAYGTSNVVGVALDVDNGKLYFAEDNSWQDSGDPTSGATGTGAISLSASTGLVGSQITPFFCKNGTQFQVNFGQRAFTHTPPVGYETLCTANIPEPTIKDGTKHFNAVIYEGTGSLLTSPSLGFQPDLTWIKNRDDSDGHILQDSARGNKVFTDMEDTAEGDTGGGWITEIADGFTADANGPINTSSESFVAWCWKESAGAGFDIVLDTGTGSAKTVSHNLGVKPEMMIRKGRDITDNWCVYHKNLSGADATEYLQLNNYGAQINLAALWNDTAPTSSVFSVGTDSSVNTDTKLFITYLFASVEGYSKVGSFQGNASTDGTFIYTGFKPAYILTKMNENASSYWRIFDATRETYNPRVKELYPNESDDEYSNTGTDPQLDFLSNGFKIRSSYAHFNGSANVIYLAFAKHPFKYANAG